MVKVKISLALASAIFFITWFIGLVSVIFRLTSIIPTSPYLLIAIIEPLSIISLFGSVLFLLEAKKSRDRWYLALPMCITVSMITMVNLLIYLSGKPFLSDPIVAVETLWIALLALLAPCSVLFFLSRHSRLTNGCVAASSVVSIFSIFSMLLALQEIMTSARPSIHAFIGLLILYWLIGMPIVGICLLASAIYGNSPGS